MWFWFYTMIGQKHSNIIECNNNNNQTLVRGLGGLYCAITYSVARAVRVSLRISLFQIFSIDRRCYCCHRRRCHRRIEYKSTTPDWNSRNKISSRRWCVCINFLVYISDLVPPFPFRSAFIPRFHFTAPLPRSILQMPSADFVISTIALAAAAVNYMRARCKYLLLFLYNILYTSILRTHTATHTANNFVMSVLVIITKRHSILPLGLPYWIINR